MRLQIWEANGVRVLDDSYNANADSMLAALQTLHDLPCSGRRVAVLGDMAELGPHTAEAHREIGRRSVELGVNRLVAVGRFARETAQAAEVAGLKDVSEFADVASAAGAVKKIVKPGDVVLLKASRATRLEKIGEALKAGL
jgi:UDP-N-acetylmuramoyl-tripeptide--D-alanyl-D-alanine ligase